MKTVKSESIKGDRAVVVRGNDHMSDMIVTPYQKCYYAHRQDMVFYRGSTKDIGGRELVIDWLQYTNFSYVLLKKDASTIDGYYPLEEMLETQDVKFKFLYDVLRNGNFA